MQHMLNLFDLFQNVALQTHKAGNLLDWILTTNEPHKENLISDIANKDFLFEYCNIKCKMVLPRPPMERITIPQRNVYRIVYICSTLT